MLINIDKSLYHCKVTINVGFLKKNRIFTILLYTNNYIVYASSSSSSSSFSSSPSPRKGKFVIKGNWVSRLVKTESWGRGNADVEV